MTAAEPDVLIWVVHQALGLETVMPSAESWRNGSAALTASRLSSLAAHLLARHRQPLPPDLRQQLEASALMAESLAERGKAQVAEAAVVLNRVGIEWVVLKGWPLAARLYPSPACRPSGDLDVLVAERDVAPASAAFEAIGYRPEDRDHGYHLRLVRKESGGVADVVELHRHPGPKAFSGPTAGQVLARRRSMPSPAGPLWIPSSEDEPDLLIRHYLRHAGYQAILLLDVLKSLDGKPLNHPLGALIGDDLARLGLARTIDGPARLASTLLRRWMQSRTFEQRRSERHSALVGIPVALSRSPRAAIAPLARVVWPRVPTPRWVAVSKTAMGRYTWRVRRLFRLGR